MRVGIIPVVVVGAIASTGACRQAAGVLFDVPPPSPASQPTSAALTAGPVVQDSTRPPIESAPTADSVLALLPRHADGGIDWLAAEREGVIRPRAAPPDARRAYLEGFGYDIVFPASNRMFEATFPHSRHVAQLTCVACHPAVFRYRDNDNSMKAISAGGSCGVCHRSVASPPSACSRCHPAMPAGTLTAQLDTGITMARAADTTATAADGYPRSRFNHWSHRIRYRCSACHPDLFALAAGADTVTMAELRAGEACGACHDGRSAFGLSDCTRCHEPATGSGP